jgi:hypothetical protein
MLKKIPRGARRTSEWAEIEVHPFKRGYCDEVTAVIYEANTVYADGLAMTANMVEVYDGGKRVYRQQFYGETAYHDAVRAGVDIVTPLVLANA